MTKKKVQKTKKKSPSQANRKEWRKQAEYLAFIEWMGTPSPVRELKKQEEFAERYGVNVATLSGWKKRDGFWEEVRKVLREFGKGKTANLLGNFYASMMNSDKPFGRDFMVWLQFIEEFSPGTRVEDVTPPREPTEEQKEMVRKALRNAGLAAIVKESEDMEDGED